MDRLGHVIAVAPHVIWWSAPYPAFGRKEAMMVIKELALGAFCALVLGVTQAASQQAAPQKGPATHQPPAAAHPPSVVHPPAVAAPKPAPAAPKPTVAASKPAATVPAGGPRALTAAYNESGQRLFKLLAAMPGNVVFSPYSIGAAMAMALSGARNANETEMRKVLGHTLQRPQIDAANAEVLKVLGDYESNAPKLSCPFPMQLNGPICQIPREAEGQCLPPRRAEGDQCVIDAVTSAPVMLRVANALMLLNDTIVPAYADLLKDKYSAELFHGANLKTINDWVNKKTEGKIESILDQLDDNAVGILLNAIYFKAPWKSRFDPQATHDATFHVASSDPAQVPMMHSLSNYVVVAREGYKAIRLPYLIDQLAMIIALPDDVAGLDKVRDKLSGDELDATIGLLHEGEPKPVDLAMPRFKASFQANLIAPFEHLGMTKAFHSVEADFSGMTGQPASKVPLAIDAIMHSAVIEVAEEGTEASAVTAVVMVTRSITTSGAEQFHVDRPFLFYLVDGATRAILFQGRIVDPRASMASSNQRLP